MPMEPPANGRVQQITYHRQHTDVRVGDHATAPEHDDRVMLIRSCKSRIYFLRQFFDYPISLSAATLRKLGIVRTVKIGISYLKSSIRPRKPEVSLEDFLVNRFGKELYLTFFKSYTEKVWGVECEKISAEWGAQRIKGLSVLKAIAHFLKQRRRKDSGDDIAQSGTETSLIEKFMYPKLGPGQLWEYVAADIKSKGGQVRLGWTVDKLHTDGSRIRAVEMVQAETGRRETVEGDYFFPPCR